MMTDLSGLGPQCCISFNTCSRGLAKGYFHSARRNLGNKLLDFTRILTKGRENILQKQNQNLFLSFSALLSQVFFIQKTESCTAREIQQQKLGKIFPATKELFWFPIIISSAKTYFIIFCLADAPRLFSKSEHTQTEEHRGKLRLAPAGTSLTRQPLGPAAAASPSRPAAPARSAAVAPQPPWRAWLPPPPPNRLHAPTRSRRRGTRRGSAPPGSWGRREAGEAQRGAGPAHGGLGAGSAALTSRTRAGGRHPVGPLTVPPARSAHPPPPPLTSCRRRPCCPPRSNAAATSAPSVQRGRRGAEPTRRAPPLAPRPAPVPPPPPGPPGVPPPGSGGGAGDTASCRPVSERRAGAARGGLPFPRSPRTRARRD